MRYRKVWQGLAIISLLVLMVAVFTATQPGADRCVHGNRLPNGLAVEVKYRADRMGRRHRADLSEPVYPAVRDIDCVNCRRSGRRSKIACCPSMKCRAAKQPNAPALPGRLTIR